MKKAVPAADPDAYVAALAGWQRECVEHLRTNVVAVSGLQEVIKWGHLVYYANGPVLLIRAEAQRVLLGFWRGQRLRHLEAALKPGGKYEMATIVFCEGTQPSARMTRQLTREAIVLNASLGDPTRFA
jgi:hypothetical protein